jgi:hypothetical protein
MSNLADDLTDLRSKVQATRQALKVVKDMAAFE